MNSTESYDMIYQTIVDCFEKNGIIVSASEKEDVDLTDYEIDSVSFISFVVDLEETLKIKLPDEILNYNILKSLNGLVNMITQFVNDAN